MKKITKEQVDDYQFTKKQIAAYESLKKAVKRCENAGLSLYGRQWSLVAYPQKFTKNHMISNHRGISKRVECPSLEGASIDDSGADDTMYILDEFIKDATI